LPASQEGLRDLSCTLALVQRHIALGANLGRDFVSQLFLKPEAEQVRSVAAIGSGHDVATEPGRTTRPSVTRRTGVSKACSQACVGGDIPKGAIVGARSQTLENAELALEDLPAAADRTSRIPFDDVDRGTNRIDVASSSTDLLRKRFGDAFVRGVG
jgi:hypothetical protein